MHSSGCAGPACGTLQAYAGTFTAEESFLRG